MTQFRSRPLTLCVLAALAVAACAGRESSRTTPAPGGAAEKAAAIAVAGAGKGSAAVDFTYRLQAPVKSGDSGAVTLSVRETYDDGVLILAMSSASGLEVFPSSSSASLPLGGQSAHDVVIYFKALADGTHYLDIVATVEVGGAVITGKSYSIPVAIGDAATGAKALDPAVKNRPDGERVIILDADETIKD